ncbi:hypothetical protein [Chlorobium sp. N1]|uniref:hypothetical protein n=1 Tax=Chlorobium sp. N1 TaxID=2491138 RepID=UPI00103D5286|nr:hypothetical protein [Chlorobium sp. N1]TCD48868.1 hypothetical protein E0L29_03005 [Chlorobium sp. N1]
MEQIVAYFGMHPVLFAVSVALALVVAVFVLFFVLKKVVQVALVAAAIVVLYAAYLYFTGAGVSPLFAQLQEWLAALLQLFSSFRGQ